MKPLSGKPKTCKECGKKFYPKRTFEKVCSIPCSLALARKQREAKEAKEQRQKVRQWKADNQTIGGLTKKAQAAFNEFIRIRDYDKPCICCDGKPYNEGVHGGAWDCGHYRGTGAAPNLRFNTYNAHKQRKRCNRELSGNAVEYRIGLIKRIGEDKVLRLESDNEPKKYSKDDLSRIEKIFRKRARLYKKLKGL